jgi:hypothetical protein
MSALKAASSCSMDVNVVRRFVLSQSKPAADKPGADVLQARSMRY